MAAKEPKKSLLDDVLARSLRNKPGFRTWFDRLAADAQAELLAVKGAFDPAQHQKNAYANAIIQCCRDRGWYVCGRQGVIDWLERP